MKRLALAFAVAASLMSTQAFAEEKKSAEAVKPAEAAKPAEAVKPAEAAKGSAVAEVAKTAAAVPAAEHRMVNTSDLKWGDAPSSLPKGAKMAVLQGDPSAPGVFTMRVMLPAGYRVPPHFHPADENVSVFSGELYMGMGDTFDETKAHAITAGGFSSMPAGVRHFAFTKTETVFQVHGMGPWGITYVNPQDDPRNAKQAAK